MSELKVGDKAPDFSLVNQNSETVTLSRLKGKKVLVYFYPKADTPGCTKQACSIRDTSENLKQKSITAIGISPDEPDKIKKFDDKYNLGFDLLSDPNHETAQAWGAWGEKSMYGKKYMGIIRSSFLVDEKGRISQASYKVKPEDTIKNALEALE
ncbi:Putative peroxiredoxin [Limihaloglobus sulfuriphilus]|uniref:thioredoxin-dependent peroxiredoxin n=1 Tax=Limihaloglobus sulfuriphilus TaxID=1851148 RepID=A0A1Q2MD86_9BACT|nr:thioredoxin-dependent thiol peroxidase [Limihaloglobus sulfuriphilus]AQQ70663.1 Putative peroxiredoxin [Limihaloglobus sulfuriphilus]